jgi:4-diphosphocytidyl-2-C-methyl-D-erythritol kinase
MRVLAPAKINLHLRVGPPRQDGFHPLLTWMVTAGLFDTLTFVRRPSGGQSTDEDSTAGPSGQHTDASRRSQFSLSSDHPSLPTDGGNLVVRVGTALADTRSRKGEAPVLRREGVSAFLIKRIPPGAGLAGGSSDAVATLTALNRLWKLDWSIERLAKFAEQFGSDLSFFFHGPSSICTGRGEIVRPIGPPAVKWAVLALPKFEMPTPAVYRRFDELSLGREEHLRDEPDFAEWATLAAKDLLPRLVNDLEPAAFSLRPQLGELRETLGRSLVRPVRMSGSGSSLFTLCDDAAEAQSLADRAREVGNVDSITVTLAPRVGEVVEEVRDES